MLRKTLHRQTRQIFKGLIQGLENAPDTEFALPARDQHASVGAMAMHIGGSIENAFATQAFQARWNTPVSSKRECIAFLESCRDALLARFIDDNDLLDPDPHPEYFVSKLDRVLKLLRHAAHHTGEINARLRALNIPRGSFV